MWSGFRRIGAAFGGLIDRLSTVLAVRRDQGLGSYLREVRGRAEDEFGRAAVPDEHEGDGGGGQPAQSRYRHDFGAMSSDINWIEYDAETRVLVVCFHYEGRIYEYPDFPFAEYQNLILGPGPFPKGREPHYMKPFSTGQYMNFRVRNDHADNLFPYRRLT